MGRSGASYGQVHYCEDDFWPHNTALYVTDFHGNDPLFAFYFLKSLDFSRYNSGGAQPSLNRNFIYPIKIRVPFALAEQQAIAEALSDVDALINALDALITKKRHIKQGTMQQLLTGQKRLPGFSGEWVQQRVGDVVSITSGESPSRFRFTGSGTPYFKVEQLNTCNKFLTSTPYYFDGSITVSKGSIVFPKRGASILLNKVRIFGQDSFMDTNLMALTCTQGVDAEFFYYALQHKQLWRIADTTSIPQINNKHVEPLILDFPPTVDEQAGVAEVLRDMESEITALEQKRDKTKLIKQGMMQELLTGKTRLI